MQTSKNPKEFLNLNSNVSKSKGKVDGIKDLVMVESEVKVKKSILKL
jgi:hypothetical protein